MNYKEKYKEVLEKAKNWHANAQIDFKKSLEALFPELAESQDEKVRKEIIHLVKKSNEQGGYALHKDEADNMIAWLEKQGRQKYTQKDVDNAYLKGVNTTKRIFEKQQKSSWSEEDINMIDWLIRCCEEEHEKLCNDKYGHQDIVSDLKSDCRKKWDWLESLKNRIVPQNAWKPSGEQMAILWNYTEQNDYDGAVLTSLYNDLKKLKEE